MTGATEWRGAVGDVWADEWRRTDRAFAELSASLDAAILAAAPSGSFRALDIGCGAGQTALTLAAARPDAAVLGIELSPAMVAVARERGATIGNAAFDAGDVVALAQRRGPFDLLCSRHGVMFFPDPPRAFAAFHEATGRDGRLVFSCFADPALNAFAQPLAQALDLPPPVAGAAPGPFAFADPDRVASLLSDAGWRGLERRRLDFSYRVGAGAAPVDDAVAFLSRIGPAAAAMRETDTERREGLRDRLRNFLTGYATPNAVDLPASAWLWSAVA